MVNMKKIITLFIIITTILILSTNAFSACEIDLTNEFLELRSTGEYREDISAEDNDEIDIRIGYDIDYVGDDCPTNIETKAKIYRTEDGSKDYYTTSTTKRQTLEEGTFLFIWANDFRVNDRYEEYRIEGIIKADEETFDLEGYVTVVNNSCDGIKIVTRDFVIDEGKEVTKTFRVENDTGTEFDIDKADVHFSTSIVSEGNVEYNSFIDRYDTEIVDVTLRGNYTSYDRTAIGRIAVSGYLGNDYCSEYDIGKESFEVTVEDTGSTSSGSSSGQCDELSIVSEDITVEENNSTRTTFYLNNESTERFEITEIDFVEEEVELNSYYFEQYVFPNNLGSITIDTIAPNLTANEIYQNKMRVKGKFSDGKTCNFDDIEKNFEVIVKEKKESLNCENFSMFVPKQAEITNSGKINYTIQNNTIRSATINLSGITNKQIVVPSNSSISNSLEISGSGEVIFNPYIPGCSLNSEKVTIIDTAKGTLSGVEMNVKIEDKNTDTLIIEFNNTTEKQFTGVLKTNIDGYFEESETITLPPGESFADIELRENDKAKTGQGTVTFDNGEEEVTQNIALGNEFFAGLFSYGGVFASIAIFLIILVIAIVVLVAIKPQKKAEKWEFTNKE